MERFINGFVSVLLIGTIGFSGCGSDSDKKKEDENISTSIPNTPFVRYFERKEQKNNQTNSVIAFWDGVEAPKTHDYILFGKGSIDNEDDDAIFARISSKDGSLKSAKYVRYININAQATNNAETYLHGATMRYDDDGIEKNGVVLVGMSRTNETSDSTGLLVTILEEGSYKWSKIYRMPNGYFLEIGDVAADDDGTFWVVGYGYRAISTNNGSIQRKSTTIVMHIDAKTGDILLSKHLHIDDYEWDSRYNDIVLTDNRVYITGKSIKDANSRRDMLLLLELDKQGELLSANKYYKSNESAFGERGDGILYKNGKIYIAYEGAGTVGGILKIDATSKEVEKAVELFTNPYNSYYRDFTLRGDYLYFSANNISFYKTDLDGNIEKIAKAEGGWKDSLFIDSSDNIIALSNNGGGGRIASFVTKFSNILEKCGVNTSVYSPQEKAKDVTTLWKKVEMTTSYDDIPVALVQDNSGYFQTGSATNIIKQTSKCGSVSY